MSRPRWCGGKIPEGRIVTCVAGCETHRVALSDDENRILREIEAQLENDRKFAKAVSASGMYRAPARRMWWALVGVVVCLVAMVLALQVHFVAGFAGFAGMLACAMVVEREARAMGRTGMKDLAETLRRASLAGRADGRDDA